MVSLTGTQVRPWLRPLSTLALGFLICNIKTRFAKPRSSAWHYEAGRGYLPERRWKGQNWQGEQQGVPSWLTGKPSMPGTVSAPLSSLLFWTHTSLVFAGLGSSEWPF